LRWGPGKAVEDVVDVPDGSWTARTYSHLEQYDFDDLRP
jgi:hypothetical protein